MRMTQYNKTTDNSRFFYDFYYRSLLDLKSESKAVIDNLTEIASKNSDKAEIVIEAITQIFYSKEINNNLGFLFLVDSIIKRVREPYFSLVVPMLADMFLFIYSTADDHTRHKLFKLLNTWKSLVPSEVLGSIVNAIKLETVGNTRNNQNPNPQHDYQISTNPQNNRLLKSETMDNPINLNPINNTIVNSNLINPDFESLNQAHMRINKQIDNYKNNNKYIYNDNYNRNNFYNNQFHRYPENRAHAQRISGNNRERNPRINPKINEGYSDRESTRITDRINELIDSADINNNRNLDFNLINSNKMPTGMRVNNDQNFGGGFVNNDNNFRDFSENIVNPYLVNPYTSGNTVNNRNQLINSNPHSINLNNTYNDFNNNIYPYNNKLNNNFNPHNPDRINFRGKNVGGNDNNFNPYLNNININAVNSAAGGFDAKNCSKDNFEAGNFFDNFEAVNTYAASSRASQKMAGNYPPANSILGVFEKFTKPAEKHQIKLGGNTTWDSVTNSLCLGSMDPIKAATMLKLLKIRNPNVINALLSGVQCGSCGLRFDSENRQAYSLHLDMHYYRNVKKGKNTYKWRPMFYPLKKWVELDEFDSSKINPTSQPVINDKPAEILYSLPSGLDTDACEICAEKLTPGWSEDIGAWHYKDVIKIENKYFHKNCHELAISSENQIIEVPSELKDLTASVID